MVHIIVMILAVIGGMTVAATVGFIIYIEIDSHREKKDGAVISNTVDGDQYKSFTFERRENGGQ